MDQRELAGHLRALSDVNRLRIIQLLASAAELSVGDLIAVLRRDRPSLSQPLISWHLRVLRKRGLIEWRREGRQIMYALNHRRWRQLTDGVDSLTSPVRVDVAIPSVGGQPAAPPSGLA